MTPAFGQVLRRIGLLVETLFLLGLLSMAQQKVPPRGFAGFDQSHVLAAGLALGFVLWIVGTAAIYWPRKSRDAR